MVAVDPIQGVLVAILSVIPPMIAITHHGVIRALCPPLQRLAVPAQTTHSGVLDPHLRQLHRHRRRLPAQVVRAAAIAAPPRMTVTIPRGERPAASQAAIQHAPDRARALSGARGLRQLRRLAQVLQRQPVRP